MRFKELTATFFLAACLVHAPIQAAPFRPASDAEVIERLPELSPAVARFDLAGVGFEANVGAFDFDRRLIILAGNVVLLRGSDRLSGGRLTIDLSSGLSTIDGRVGGGSPALGDDGTGAAPRGGRISGTFTVPKKSN